MSNRMGRLDMDHGTRWDGRLGTLRWTGFRSNHIMRDAAVTLLIPGRRRLHFTVQAHWTHPDTDERIRAHQGGTGVRRDDRT